MSIQALFIYMAIHLNVQERSVQPHSIVLGDHNENCYDSAYCGVVNPNGFFQCYI